MVTSQLAVTMRRRGYEVGVLDAGGGLYGKDGVLIAVGAGMHTEGLGDRGAGDVGVQHGHAVAAAAQGDGQLTGDHGLTHAALAGHYAVYLTYAAAVAQRLDLEGAVFTLAAVFTAAAAVVIAIALGEKSPFLRAPEGAVYIL